MLSPAAVTSIWQEQEARERSSGNPEPAVYLHIPGRERVPERRLVFIDTLTGGSRLRQDQESTHSPDTPPAGVGKFTGQPHFAI
jgi:hypothetical protein